MLMTNIGGYIAKMCRQAETIVRNFWRIRAGNRAWVWRQGPETIIIFGLTGIDLRARCGQKTAEFSERFRDVLSLVQAVSMSKPQAEMAEP